MTTQSQQNQLTPEMIEQQRAQRAALPPTTLYLIRHGEPATEFHEIFYGQMDVPLSERGQTQSREVAQRLSAVPIDAVYSSDLERAAFLADQIAEPRELPVRRLEVFRERNMGLMQGYTKEQLERDFAEDWGRFQADRIRYRVTEGESFEDLSGRIIPAVEELVASFPGRRVVLACHAGPIRVAMAHVLGFPLDHIFRLTVNYCGIFAVEFPEGAPPRVTLMNG